MNAKDLISLNDLHEDELAALLLVAAKVKADPAAYADGLAGKTLALYFEKPSLRTRITFEVGMNQLGGHALYMGPESGRIGLRESVPDVARNLERWVDGIMARTFSHQLVVDLARYASVPVINGLTDYLHPCQALADLLTLQERWGELKGRKLAYVGDGNNVAHSLLFGGAKVGLSVSWVGPPGHEPNVTVVDQARATAAGTGATIQLSHDPAEGLKGADAVYTDVWASMGQEDEAAARKLLFAPYQVNAALMSLAEPGALFLHCLPAHRGDEVTDEVADAPTSVIFDEAENRLHAQKALLLALLADR